MADDKEQEKDGAQSIDVDRIIEERERLDKLFKDNFTRNITVVFTDLKGSTSLAETHGDFATRTIIKRHNDIVLPAIKKHNGNLVKTMGDGTMSYFEHAQDALRAMCEIQKGMEAFNMEKHFPIPVLMRIGIHAGRGIVEKNDIFGDIVNVASRIEGQASPGEIYISEEAYNSLADKGEIHCSFAKEAVLKGKKEPMRLYKAYWNPTEADRELTAKPRELGAADKKKMPGYAKLAVAVLLVLLAAAARRGPKSST